MKNLAIKALRQIEASAEKGIWDAHRGCAAIAAALLVQKRLVSDASAGAVEARAFALLNSERETLPSSVSVSHVEFTTRVLSELAIAAEEPKELGHDIIYAAYVFRALDVFAIDPWRSLLEAVITLIRKVKSSGPGWITVNGKSEKRVLSETLQEPEREAWAVFRQFDRPLAMEVGDMQLGHLLTHGHAIETLCRYGAESFRSAMDIAYGKRLRGLRAANDEELSTTPLRRMVIDPRTDDYWKCMGLWGDMHGHVIKYAHSFLELRWGRISQQDLEAFGRIVWPDQPPSAFK